MTRIAVIADSHLPDDSDTIKEEVFEWALATAIERKADVIVAAGDLTAMGTMEAAKRIKQKMDATNLPYLITPGNAERRSPEFREAVLSEFKTSASFEQNSCSILVLDSSQQKLTDNDRKQIVDLVSRGQKQLFVATHFPLASFPQKDQGFLRRLLADGIIGVLVAGHLHRNGTERIGKGEYHLVRGIDPDKAIGGPPDCVFFDFDSKTQYWQRLDSDYRIDWTAERSDEFRDLLGFSCMRDSFGGIKDAISMRVKSIELRFECTKNISTETLFPLLEQWRAKGGRYLSIHLPDILWDLKNSKVEGVKQVKTACEFALKIHANRLTMHVPRCPVGLICKNTDIKNKMLDAYADALKRVLEHGITLGIENLHRTPDEKIDSTRGFGYTPTECLDWINALRKKTNNDKIGFHFDIGHARNNAPYSSVYSISQWFAKLGNLITGYHLHQVEQAPDGKLMNHCPVTGMFGPLISFCSLFIAWNENQIKHVPMYLEIRGENAIKSLNCFRQYRTETKRGLEY
ncbi:MAG: TIM barrel protein [Lentisphaeria bacterium]